MKSWPSRALRAPSLGAQAALGAHTAAQPLRLLLRSSILFFACASLFVASAAFAQSEADDDAFLFGDDVAAADEADEADAELADEDMAAETEAASEIADDAALGEAPPEETTGRQRKIEELTVTGRKREEELQRIPTSVRAFGTAEIEERNMQRIDEIGFATANLQFTGSDGSSRNTRIFIRGIGQADARSILDPGVGLYIDNVYIPRATNALIDLVDLERIDVLRGPQGTLFGKNTVGGLVNVISAKPAQELGFGVRLNVGSFDMLETRFTLDVPITAGWFDEKLFTRWTIATATDDGYLTNVYDGSESGDNKLLSGRFAATLLPTEGLTLNTTFDWMRSNENAMVGRCKIAGQESATPTQTPDGLKLSYGPYVIARYVSDNFGTRDDSANPPGFVPGQEYRFPEACAGVDALDRFDGYANPLARLRENVYGASVDLDWAMPDSWMPDWMTTDLRNVTGFRLRDQDNGPGDFDGTAIDYVTLGAAPTRHYAISNDLTASMQFETWTPDLGIRAIVGVFGFYENESTGGFGDINRGVALGQNADFNAETYPQSQLAGLVNALGTTGKTGDQYVQDALRYGSGQLNTQTSQKWNNLSIAGYAHVELDVFEDWSVSGGVRYSWERIQRDGAREGLLCGEFLGDRDDPLTWEVPTLLPAIEGPNRLCGPGDVPDRPVIRRQEATWHRPTPEAGVQYQIDDDRMTYFRYAQGWKSGGFNREVLTERRDDFTSLHGISDQFEPEIVNAYEVGFKSTWFDNQVLLNASLYWNDYSNLQITALEPDENGLVSANITNAADAVTRGFELEGTTIPDWDWLPGPDAQLIVTAGFGFTDAFYKDYTAEVANSPYPVIPECTSLRRVEGADPFNCNGEIDAFVDAVIVASVLQIPPGTAPDDRSDKQFANVPKLNFNISAIYNFRALDIATVSTSIRYYYQTDMFFNTANSPNLYQPGYGLLDGSMAFIIDQTDTRIEIWAKNLTDKQYLQGGFSFGPAFGADGVYVGRPRSFGMTLTQHF